MCIRDSGRGAPSAGGGYSRHLGDHPGGLLEICRCAGQQGQGKGPFGNTAGYPFRYAKEGCADRPGGGKDVYKRQAYQSGTSEQYLGRALRDFARREDVVVATKFLPRTQAEIEAGITGQQHIEQMINTLSLIHISRALSGDGLFK